MASFLGSCPSLSTRLCHIAARCLHSQGRKHLTNPPSLKQWRKALHTVQNRILVEQSTKTVSYGRSSLTGIHLNPCYNNSRCNVVLPVLRQGNNMVYVRFLSKGGDGKKILPADVFLYMLSVFILFIGLGYAGVPLFKIFCRQFGIGGDPSLSRGHDKSKVATMEKVEDREITVQFCANKQAAMRWNFQPQQARMKVKLGETALAFFRAENPTDKPIIGIATYTVTPYAAAPYFNKIQCFCFEEQILNPHEQVDMPVFFYIDPEFDDDFELEFEDSITLSYTFFEAKDGVSFPLPGFQQPAPEAT